MFGPFGTRVWMPAFLGVISALNLAIAEAQSPPSPPLISTVWGPSEDSALVCEQADQGYTLKPGEIEAVFTYRVRNVSKEDAIVLNVMSSCSCATPKHPATPWRIGAGESGQMQVVMDLRGKSGTVVKTAAIETTKGVRPLTMRVTIPAAPATSVGSSNREKNIQLATADRQAVFKGDCVKCHVTPAVGLMGQALYTAACGICHEAEHRASMVPNLRTLQHPTNREYWFQIIAEGKPGTLMPAFAHAQGGPLAPAQIESLARYLTETLHLPGKSPAKATTAK
jgi:mono/diheme cytochrome c family protein